MEALADAFLAIASAILEVLVRLTIAVIAQFRPGRRQSPIALDADTRTHAWRFWILAPICLGFLVIAAIVWIKG